MFTLFCFLSISLSRVIWVILVIWMDLVEVFGTVTQPGSIVVPTPITVLTRIRLLLTVIPDIRHSKIRNISSIIF